MSGPASSLSEALRHDQRDRWVRGDRVLVESYVDQFPALAAEPQALLDLVLAEYSLREELGETPSVDEYVSRFPSLSDQLSSALRNATRRVSAGSADTGPADLTAVCKPISCPFCAAPVTLPEGGDVADTHCPRCGRQIHVLDETVSVRAKSGRTIGVFELIERAGRGQFGEVWRARDSRLRRDVAIKLPREPERDAMQAELFLREARASARLRHPNIVPVYEAGRDDGQAYIVTAFIRGTTLKQILSHKKFTPQEAARLCREVGAGLEHAHQEGIVHRDLKPSNILIDETGTPFIADFGLAKHSGVEEITVTVDGNILGTPAYMSPEQARGKAREAGPASDIYSLGVILYQLLTGKRPFEGPLQVLMHRILTEEPAPPRDVDKSIPRDLETICLKAMAKSPSARYATAREMTEDLDRFLRGEPIQARRASPVERAWRGARRRLPVAALILAAFVAAVGLAIGMREREAPAPPPQDPWEAMAKSGMLPMPASQQAPSSEYAKTVEIHTNPEGAAVVCYELDFETARPVFSRRVEVLKTPAKVRLNSGMHLVVAYNKDGFHEVLRTVPRNPLQKMGPFAHEDWTWHSTEELLTWPRIDLFPNTLAGEDLVECHGQDEFQVDLTSLGSKIQRWRVPAFLLEVTELSVGKYKRLRPGGIPAHPELEANQPAVSLSWDLALSYAESRGMRLPDLIEVECAATAGGTMAFPWGNEPPPDDNWNFLLPVGKVAHDRLPTQPPIVGLVSGPLEWTMTRTQVGFGAIGLPYQRYVVRGGPPDQIPGGIAVGRWWSSVSQADRFPAVGVRCARSTAPRLKEEDFLTLLP